MQYAEKIGLTLLGSEAYNKIHSSVIIASALHDLGKCGRYGSPYYVANMVQDGRPTKKNPEQKYKRSESKPYKISSDLCHIDHPLRSVELAARYIDLTEEEEHAIFYHDGAYGSLAYDLKGHEEPLQVIIHFADFWSAQFLEVGKLDRFNDQVKSEETTDEVKRKVKIMKNKNSYEVLEAEVAKLKEENRHLKDERDELKYMLNDMHSVVDAANDDFFNEMSRLCGCIEIEGTRITAAYQDLVGILLANGYTVEVTPLHNNTRLQVVIKESEDEINE